MRPRLETHFDYTDPTGVGPRYPGIQDLSPRLQILNFRLNTRVPRCQKADSPQNLQCHIQDQPQPEDTNLSLKLRVKTRVLSRTPDSRLRPVTSDAGSRPLYAPPGHSPNRGGLNPRAAETPQLSWYGAFSDRRLPIPANSAAASRSAQRSWITGHAHSRWACWEM